MAVVVCGWPKQLRYATFSPELLPLVVVSFDIAFVVVVVVVGTFSLFDCLVRCTLFVFVCLWLRLRAPESVCQHLVELHAA